ncbi:hypothetical protein AB3S75_022775 [Citrus x aurantiifolia]
MEGVSSTIQSFSHLARDSSLAYSRDFNKQSLGSEEVAGILLWSCGVMRRKHLRNLRTSLLWFCYFLGFSVVEEAMLLLLVSAVPFEYGILPSNIAWLRFVLKL